MLLIETFNLLSLLVNGSPPEGEPEPPIGGGEWWNLLLYVCLTLVEFGTMILLSRVDILGIVEACLKDLNG